MSILLCDNCSNKAICRVRAMKDELYPHTIIEVSECRHYGGAGVNAAPVVPAPVQRAPRDMRSLANISARIKALENTGNTKEKTEGETFKCPKCHREVLIENVVTDISTGEKLCQECYDKA